MQIVKLLLCIFAVAMTGALTELVLTPLVGVGWAKLSYLVTIGGTIYVLEKFMS
jgi:hypothetical protein